MPAQRLGFFHIQLLRDVQRLSSRRRAHIDHPVPGLRVRQLAHEHGAYILHHKESFPEAVQAVQMIIARERERIGKIRMGFRFHALLLQDRREGFRRLPVQTAARCDRLHPLGISQHRLDHVLIERLLPELDDPLRAGISHRQGARPFLRVSDLIHSSRHAAQYTVYISPKPGKSFLHRQLYRLAAHGTVRHTVHIFQLVDRAAQEIADDRLHLLYFHF